MAYCKWCGMDSRDARRCEWCGKDLNAPVQTAPPPARDYVAAFEEENRGLRVAFYISSVALILVASALLGWRPSLYPWVALSMLFIAGILLGALRILPPLEEEWHEFIVPIILLLFFPTFLVYVGYLTYGLMTKNMDLTTVWLLSVYFAMLMLIDIAFVIVVTLGSGTVPMSMLLQVRGVEVLGLVAIVLGWGASSMFRPMNK